MTELKNYSEINRLYKKNYEENEFTEFEKKIFNSKILLIEKKDLEKIENLISLANYYEIKENESELLKIISKLIEKNNSSGYIKAGNYYFIKKKDIKKAINFYEQAYEKFNNINAALNLVFILSKNNEYDKAKQLCYKLILQGEYKSIFHMAVISAGHNKSLECYLYLLLGIKYNDSKCFEMFEKSFNNSFELREALEELPFKGDLIKNKIEWCKKNPNVLFDNVNNVNTPSPKNVQKLLEMYIYCITYCDENDLQDVIKELNFNTTINEIREILELLTK